MSTIDIRQRMLEIIQFNKGYLCPEEWIDYGIRHNFQKVESTKLNACPDCSSTAARTVGQYIYYSTLVRLRTCLQCGLVFSDTRIDAHTIQSHFDRAYKDETYFQYQRRRIFEQISLLVDRVAPIHGQVLDVGGAKGHLLEMIVRSRNDVRVVLNDLSPQACQYAASRYGFGTIEGSIAELGALSSRFDIIILSDVLYYEQEIHSMWQTLSRIVSDNGALVIRLPNKWQIIKLFQSIHPYTNGQVTKQLQDRITFFNPEHLYIFSRAYLESRLVNLGFTEVVCVPSELLMTGTGDVLKVLFFKIAKLISVVTFGRIILTPSFLVIAKKKA